MKTAQIAWPALKEFSFPVLYTTSVKSPQSRPKICLPFISSERKSNFKRHDRKLAGCGLLFKHLYMSTYIRHGKDGIIHLTEKKGKKDQVTSRKKIFNSLNEWLAKNTTLEKT